MPTLDDVARDVGVHPSTVSRALSPSKAALVNPETRRAVEEAARRLGYRPHMVARGLQSGRTATIGVVAADLGNPFVTPIIHGITAALEGAEIMPVIAETQDEHDRFARILDHMLSRRVDAVISLAARAGDRQILEDANRIAPVVVAGRPLLKTALPQVIHDDARGGRLAAHYLSDLGHARVAQLRGPLDVGNFDQRATGFSAMCRELGVLEIELDEVGSLPTVAEGSRLTEALLRSIRDLPTALFAHNDLMAMGALDALRIADLGVPEDVSVVGYNNLPLTELVTPALSTIRYPSREIGLAAGELVIRLLAGEEPESVCLEPELIVRGSTSSA